MSATMAILGIVMSVKLHNLNTSDTQLLIGMVSFLFSWVWFGKWWLAIWIGGAIVWKILL